MFLQDIFYIRRRSLVGNIMIHVVPLSEIQFYTWRYFASIIAIGHPVGNSIYGKYPTGLATECRKSIIPTRRNYIFGRGLGKQSSTFCISIIKQHIVLSRERWEYRILSFLQSETLLGGSRKALRAEFQLSHLLSILPPVNIQYIVVLQQFKMARKRVYRNIHRRDIIIRPPSPRTERIEVFPLRIIHLYVFVLHKIHHIEGIMIRRKD